MSAQENWVMPVLVPLPIHTRGKPWYVRGYRWLFGRRTWRLKEDFFFSILGVTILIPAGFETDFASIPRIFWPLLSPTGILMIPAILHDWYYRYNYFKTREGSGSRPFRLVFIGQGKRFADRLFRNVAEQVNGMTVPNWAAWIALGIFGWLAWLKHRRTIRTSADGNEG